MINTNNNVEYLKIDKSKIVDLNELNSIRKECKIYLKEFLINVENYIDLKKFIET